MHRLVSPPHRKARSQATPSPTASPQEGLTRVEVLIASVILMVGVLGAMAVFPQAIGAAHQSSHRLVLNQLTNEKLESLRALDYNHDDLTVGVHPPQQFDSHGEVYYAVPGFAEDYSLRWTVQTGPTDGSGTAEPNIKTVVVEATYWVRYTLGGVPIEDDASLSIQVQTYLTSN